MADLLTRWPALDSASKYARLAETFTLSAGALAGSFAARTAAASQAAAGLFRRDASVWTSDPAVQTKIANRLGWLDSPSVMAEALDRLRTFAQKVRGDGTTDVVLVGMGGSSLAPEVMRGILGVAPGWPRFHMLDSTDPAAIRAVSTPPASTLYLISSKSGTTIEPNSLAAYFQRTLEEFGVHRWADHFVAITDEGTELAHKARAEDFRDLFINPSDIGGRYSALSFFGLVPAALMGQDVASIVGWGVAMLSATEESVSASTPSGAVSLGLAIGSAALAGRDKLTLVGPEPLAPFGLWIEQLIAESTGKGGKGIVPVAGEDAGGPDAYGDDRFFVRMSLDRAGSAQTTALTADFHAGGAPVATIDWPERSALGAEFVRWEIATAIAGAVIGINPFDEPNVQQAKDATRRLLDAYVSRGSLPIPLADRTVGKGITLTATDAARKGLAGKDPEALLTLLREGDYFALLAYVGADPGLADALHAFRQAIRDRTKKATMFGYGPRYLHSTGQLHKGGPNTGVFLLLSAVPSIDLPIPGQEFSFGTLELAQALGDFASLDREGRRAVHVHLPDQDSRLVRTIAEIFLSRL